MSSALYAGFCMDLEFKNAKESVLNVITIRFKVKQLTGDPYVLLITRKLNPNNETTE